MVQSRTVPIATRAVSSSSIIDQISNLSLRQRNPLSNRILSPSSPGDNNRLSGGLANRVLRQTAAIKPNCVRALLNPERLSIAVSTTPRVGNTSLGLGCGEDGSPGIAGGRRGGAGNTALDATITGAGSRVVGAAAGGGGVLAGSGAGGGAAGLDGTALDVGGVVGAGSADGVSYR
jgi:hypothetical protein